MEHKEAKNNQSEHLEEKRIPSPPKKHQKQKNEDSISSFWDFNQSNIHTIWMPEGEEKEQETGNLFEKIMKEKFPNLVKEVDMQVQEAHRIPNEMHAKRPTSRYSIIKMPKVKDKERNLKSSMRIELVTCREVPIRLLGDFSKETLQAGRYGQEIFKVMKSRDLSQDCSTQQSYHLQSKGR